MGTNAEPLLEGYRLSPQQERLWKLTQRGHPLVARLALLISGPLERDRLREALLELVDRHEILRTNFFGEGEDGLPLQVVRPESRPPWRQVDLSPLPSPRRGVEARRLVHLAGRRPFDLARDPLMRVTLIELSITQHVLVLHLPSLCADGWTLSNLFRELVRCYTSLQRLAPHERPMPYAQFSEWQRQLVELEETSADREVWLQKDLAPFFGARLPFQRGDSAVAVTRLPRPHFLRAHLPREVVQELRRVSQVGGIEIPHLLLAAWAATLARWGQLEEVPLAVGSAARAYEDLHDTLGPFSKFLPLALTYRDSETFDALAVQVRALVDAAEDWQEYFAWDMLERRDEPRRLPFCFDSVSQPGQLRSGATVFGLLSRTVLNEWYTARLQLLTTAEQARLELSYDPLQLDGGDARRLLHGTIVLLLAGLREPQRPVRYLPLLTAQDRRRVLYGFSPSPGALARAPMMGSDFVPHRVLEWALQQPAAVAVEDEETRLTFFQLVSGALAVARMLERAGVGRGQLVAVCTQRDARVPMILLGVLWSGAAYLPVDPELPDDRLSFLIEDSGISSGGGALLVPDGELRKGLRKRLAKRLGVAIHGLTLLDADFAHDILESETVDSAAVQELRRAARDLPALSGDDPAYAIYTSGSTGRPKAAVNTHRALTNRLLWMQRAMSLGREDVFLHKTPFSFDVSVWEIFLPLILGARMVVATPEGHRDPAYLAQLMQRRRVTTVHFVPSMLGPWLEQAQLHRGAHLTRVVCSGEPLTADLVARFDAVVGVALWNLYGPTEAAVDVTAWRARSLAVDEAPPIGRPIDNLRLTVLDRYLMPVPPGVPGEICIGGVGLASGYLRRPSLTAGSFLPDPWSGEPGARLYRTGDLGRWRENGELQFLSRLDDQLKIRGFRIEPGEVESVLRTHRRVAEAVVVGRDGPAGPRLVAYFVPSSTTEPDGDALQSLDLARYLGERLPAHMVPAFFVSLESLPRLTSGKVDRRALPDPEVSAEGAGPRNQLEERLLTLWRRVLGAPEAGIFDDFLALGGDSILAMQVASGLHQLGLAVAPAQIFQHRTVAALASKLERRADAAADGPVVGPVPLTPIQHWFFERRLEQPHHWNQAFWLKVSEDLDRVRLSRSLGALLKHHDGLRLIFPGGSQASGWRQEAVDAEAWVPPLTTIELADLPAEQKRRAVERIEEQVQRSFDLARGPLWRVLWLPSAAADGSHLLFVVAHHLIIDGVSWRVILEDLESAYRAQEGLAEPSAVAAAAALPPRTASLRSWSHFLERHAGSPDALHQLDYWLALPWDEAAPLPVDFAGSRETNRIASTAQLRRRLDPLRTSQLLGPVHGAYRTEIEDLLITALARSVSRWTGASSVPLALEGHGRQPLSSGYDLSRTVGWLTSLFPLVINFAQGEVPNQALVSVKEQLRRLPDRGLGFGLLRYLDPSGEAAQRLRSLPPLEISFNYLGRLDLALSEEGLFQALGEPVTGQRGGENQRPFLLEVDCWVIEGQLEVMWTYSSTVHRRETVEALADHFISALGALVEHCVAPGAGALSPSDFPLATIRPRQLSALVEDLGDPSLLQDLYPTSSAQEGMLVYLRMREEDTPVYFNQLHCMLDGPLDLAVFRRAWQQASDRHGALRTAFRFQDLPRPLQVVQDRVEPRWTLRDFRDLDSERQQRDFQELLDRDRRTPFDLLRAPLWRLTLVRVGDHRHRFVLSYHHLVMDGWSVATLLRDALVFYRAGLAGRVAELPVAASFRDYVAWQGQRDDSRDEGFWSRRLAGFRHPTRMRVERAAGLPGVRFDRLRGSFDEEQTTAITAAGRRDRLTLNTLAQGAWALTLAQYADCDEVLFGAVVSGRELGYDHTLGVFINALPVRVKIPAGSEAEENATARWLAELQSEQVEQRRFEATPLELIHRASEVSHLEALFDSLLVFENYPVAEELSARGGDLQVVEVSVEERTNYPLTLFAFPGRELAFELDFDLAVYDRSAVEQILDRFMGHLLRLAQSPESPVRGHLELAATEQRQVVESWGRSQPLVAAGASLDSQRGDGSSLTASVLDSFLERAGEAPESAVWADVKGRPELSYGELERRSANLAAALRGEGHGEGSVIAVDCRFTAASLVAVLGVMRAGAAYLPLDPDWPPQRCRWVMADAGAQRLLSDRPEEEIRQRLEGRPMEETEGSSGEPTAAVGELPAIWGAEVLGAAEPTVPLQSTVSPQSYGLPLPAPRSVAYVIYTSGSSGQPKGVAVSHRALSHFVSSAQQAYRLGSGDRMLRFASLAFDASIEEIFLPLAAGATLTPRDDRMLAGATDFIAGCVQRGVTVVDLPTAFWHRLVESVAEGETMRLPATLRLVIIGGERAHWERLEGWHRNFLPAVPVVNSYGPTEATVVALTEHLQLEAAEHDLVPIGRPIPGVTARVCDRFGRPVPPGVPGELLLGGEGLANGYLRRPALTALRFVPDAFASEPGARLYCTGDLVRWLGDGRLHFEGRLDAQMKIRGVRVEAMEVEAALAEHPTVKEAAVTLRRDLGGEERLAAYVVLTPDSGRLALEGAAAVEGGGGELSPAELQAFLRRRLPEVMVPSLFAEMEALPRTAGGKIDRGALPRDARGGGRGEYVPPRNETEEAVAQLFEELLLTESVGAFDNFFDLGGHSLMATQLIAQVREIFGVDLPLRLLFENPTVARLSAEIVSLILDELEAGGAAVGGNGSSAAADPGAVAGVGSGGGGSSDGPF
ncbi:MAG: amino acid adenylation domain-containing protein [Acidobacteriota bacterium]